MPHLPTVRAFRQRMSEALFTPRPGENFWMRDWEAEAHGRLPARLGAGLRRNGCQSVANLTPHRRPILTKGEIGGDDKEARS
jgi:hypothetical protein